jgi:hypothetical protein
MRILLNGTYVHREEENERWKGHVSLTWRLHNATDNVHVAPLGYRGL